MATLLPLTDPNMASLLWLIIMVAAASGVLLLVLLQTDAVSRLVLKPARLSAKRWQEYRHRWSNALQKSKLQLQYACVAGSLDEQMAENTEAGATTLLDDDDDQELSDLAKRLVTNTTNVIRPGKLGTDPKLKQFSNKCNELYVWLYAGEVGSIIYQVPLVKFGTLLAEEFLKELDGRENKPTFTFVLDASSGMGSQSIPDVVRAVKAPSVAIVPEPLWMVFLTVIVEQEMVDRATLEKILYAFCQLEAASAMAQAQSAVSTEKVPKEEHTQKDHQPTSIDTILITVPGQSMVSTMLPLIHSVFPSSSSSNHRQIFAYTDCADSVQYALQQRNAEARATIPKTTREAMQFNTNPTLAHGTPLHLMGQSEKTKRKAQLALPEWTASLASLPLQQADTVEAWMTAVDAFWKLKNENSDGGADGKQERYLPYVLRLDYLLSGSNNDDDSSEKSDQYWSLVSLLQYILIGAPSTFSSNQQNKFVSSQQVDAALSVLRDHYSKIIKHKTLTVNESAIAKAVGQHKAISAEKPILVDTVQPQEHWTLCTNLS